MFTIIVSVVIIFLLGGIIYFLGHIWDTLEDILTVLNEIRDIIFKE